MALAARLAVRLRAAGARAVLETERGVDETLAIAEASGIPRVVAVGDAEALTLHDLVALSESPCTVAQLERLAREEGPAR